MAERSPNREKFCATIQQRAARYHVSLNEPQLHQLAAYYELLERWNPRLHLVAPCSAREFATRHVLESLLLLPHLPPDAQLIDIGSGGGLPAIPCLIARPDLRVMMVESSARKCVFLREALRATGGTDQAQVQATRFEEIAPPPASRYLSCRALDRFRELLPRLIIWAPRPCTLLLFGGPDLQSDLAAAGRKFTPIPIPDSERRLLFVVERD